MKYKIQYPKSFSKKVLKLAKSNSALKDSINKVFLKIEENPFTPSLKTHKLSGNLKDTYSCSVTEDLRITFELTGDTVHLLNIGSHDEVY